MLRSRFAIIITAIVIVPLAGGAIYLNANLHNTKETMAFIESRIGPTGFVDWDQTICVESIDDIGWFKKKDNWYIQFGKLRLEFSPRNLRDKDFLAQAQRIGIDVRGNLEEENLRFYWHDEEIQEWVAS